MAQLCGGSVLGAPGVTEVGGITRRVRRGAGAQEAWAEDGCGEVLARWSGPGAEVRGGGGARAEPRRWRGLRDGSGSGTGDQGWGGRALESDSGKPRPGGGGGEDENPGEGGPSVNRM